MSDEVYLDANATTKAASRERVCTVCGKTFPKGYRKRAHEQWKHGIDHQLKSYHCTFPGCPYTSGLKTNLKNHAAVHTDKHSLCPHCGRLRKNLERHISKMHLNVRPFICQVCGLSFGEVHTLTAHNAARHTVEKEYQCTHCSYASNIKQHFANHMHRIHGEKASFGICKVFKCPLCEYEVLTKSQLTKHLNSHEKKRQYKCDMCVADFITQDTLRNHIAWKHSTKLLPCLHCDYTTKVAKRLKEHVKVKHTFKGLKPYGCPYCTFTCAYGGNCRKHVMKRHPSSEVRYNKNKLLLTDCSINSCST